MILDGRVVIVGGRVAVCVSVCGCVQCMIVCDCGRLCICVCVHVGGCLYVCDCGLLCICVCGCG